jgi:Sulfotransferase family
MNKFFILGCPRSGTTMLQQALNRHSQIVIPPETKLFFSFLGHSRGAQRKHVERLNRDLDIQLPPPNRRITTMEDARAFYELLMQLYLERLGRDQVSYFGEKTPEHTGQLNKIKYTFPEAKFLFIYRDGRDVALSLRKVPWMQDNIYVNFRIWLYYYWHLRQARGDSQVEMLCLKYEDLVTNPSRQLGNVLNFLGLPYEHQVAAGHGNAEGIPAREYAWKARALEPIRSHRIGCWKHELTEEEIAVLETLGAEALRTLGYQLTTAGAAHLSLGFYAKLYWNLFRFSTRLPWRSLVNEVLAPWTERPTDLRSAVPPYPGQPPEESQRSAPLHADRLSEVEL